MWQSQRELYYIIALAKVFPRNIALHLLHPTFVIPQIIFANRNSKYCLIYALIFMEFYIFKILNSYA